jgi:hypothetical protein
MSHADYDIVRVEPDRVFIIDLDLGHKSITNDAEHIYFELQDQWPSRRVIYRDSMGRWDEIKSVTVRVGGLEFEDYIVFIPYKEHLPKV